jgi:hypothetical protein
LYSVPFFLAILATLERAALELQQSLYTTDDTRLRVWRR